MKRKSLFVSLLIIAVCTFGSLAFAQDAPAAGDTTIQDTAAAAAPAADTMASEEEAVAPAAESTVHQVIKQKFIEGGWEWMSPILLCMIIGLAIVVERIIYLNLATTNTKKLLAKN